MTDEKLIAELRTKHPSLVTQSMFMADAANRIEAPGNTCKEWAEVSQSNYQRAKAAEARAEQAEAERDELDFILNEGGEDSFAKVSFRLEKAEARVAELEMVVFGLESILWSIAHPAAIETKEVLMEVARATLEVRGK